MLITIILVVVVVVVAMIIRIPIDSHFLPRAAILFGMYIYSKWEELLQVIQLPRERVARHPCQQVMRRAVITRGTGRGVRTKEGDGE